MTNKTKRLKFIMEFIKANACQNQSDLIDALSAQGFKITQPSLSRDLKELGIMKVNGCYRATATEKLSDSSSLVFHHITNMHSAGQNLFIIKTEQGAANVVASTIDQMKLDGILGTVAGDDTIMLATRNRASQNLLFLKLKHSNPDSPQAP